MIKTALILAFSLLTISTLVAQVTPVMVLPEFSEMRFTNRASCALDSKLPTDSAFVLINNMDIARSVYRLAKTRGEDSSALTTKGIQVYRHSIIQLLQFINKKIVNRDLPLLPSDSTSANVPAKYRKVMQQCKNDSYCPELDEYLETIWKTATSEVPGKIPQLQKFDNFRSDSHFLSKSVFENDRQQFNLNCSYLKKFSPLQAELFGSKPTKEVFDQIGAALSKSGEYIAECGDFKAQESVKVASYEISLPKVGDKAWDAQGFDYWNSMKIYLSWAFRNAPEMQKLAFPFTKIFSAVAIEDSVIIVPTGCKSITTPKCEADYLNQNAIREFAKHDFKKEAANLDLLTSIPEGAQQDMMIDPFTEVNRDILDFAQFKNADAWLDNFRENFSGARTLIRKNLLQAVTSLDVISKKIDPAKLTEKVTDHFQVLNNSSLSKEESLRLKNELFYLCAEFAFAGNEELSFIKNKLNLLKKVTLLDPVTSTVVDQSSSTYFEYFDLLSKQVNKMCYSLQQNKIWDKDFVLDKTGYSPWYINKVYENRFKSTQIQRQTEYLKTNTPALAYSNYNITKSINDVVCVSAPECARKIVKSIIDVYAATQYADTFWNLNNQIKTPGLFNPYAERTACKVYDPWYKTKATMFGFATDVAQAGLSIFAPGVVFAKFDLQPGRVVSFNQLVSEGKIQYDTKYEKQKVTAGLALDFGKLLGVPCGVSISRTAEMNPYEYLQFQGVGVRACRENEVNTINVQSASDISVDEGSKYSQCLVCSLNFETVTSVASGIMPAASSTFFLVRAVFRLYKGLTDPLNIPRDWNVNPKLVKLAYDAYKGDIPKRCVSELSKGRGCMKSLCDTEIAEVTAKYLKGDVQKIMSQYTYSGRASVQISTCKKPIELLVHETGGFVSPRESGRIDRCVVKINKLPEGCESILK